MREPPKWKRTENTTREGSIPVKTRENEEEEP